MTQITTTEDNAIRNWQKLEPILEHLKDVNLAILKGRLERGMWLKRIKTEKLYVGYDGWVSSWAEFLDNVAIARETARQDMEIYDQFAAYLQNTPKLMDTLSYERLVRLLPVVKKEPDLKQSLLDMASTASRADFDNNVKELKGQVADDKCINPTDCTSPKIILEKCQICGVIYRRKDLE
tara:strand:+ start:253 stop:792 length:540 start_codon:yes stop_codon:yes gene_type:complete